MSQWSEAKLKARQVVHDTFALPAVFYETTSSTPSLAADIVQVRYHDKSKAVGDLAGTNLSYAETMERPAQIIFLTAELEARNLTRGSVVTLRDYTGTAVGYFIDNVDPPDGLTTTTQVTPLSATELSGKLLPDGTTA